jgi:NAD(P)-dependent dehydrogenase (short-subunit alcohol dehydrogenase family)
MTGTAVITGAGAGIGKATACRFLAAGWNVALIGRRSEPLLEISNAHANAIAVRCDVSKEAEVDRAFAAIAAHFGRIDLLFNNAGIFTPAATIDQTPVSDWQASLDVNLTGAFLCARAAFGIMRAQDPQGGRIINNGSVSAQAPRPGSTPYTATKHAITGLTKTISLDGRSFDIACGQIDIGNAMTDMVAGIAKGAVQADGSVRPEPVMPVAQVADAVLYMAGLPPEANVPFMTLMATNMPLVGRG